MAFFKNPKTLYFGRIWQSCFALAWLIVAAWCSTHRQWWDQGIDGALALGVISTVFTFALSAHGIWTYHRSNPFAGSGTVMRTVKVSIEVIMALVWIGTTVLMFRPKGTREGIFDPNDLPPQTQWDVATAFAIVEFVSFIVSLVLVIFEDALSKSAAGAGPSYV